MSNRRGIILSGGKGSRLYPLTRSISKQLLPVFDKPMIYYPLSVLMLADIREILIITNPFDADNYKALLGDGSQWGLEIQYAQQEAPEGIPQALQIGREFLRDEPSALILGDNIFYGDGLGALVATAAKRQTGASVFAYWVDDPSRYGIVEFDQEWRPTALVEKPVAPRSNYAVTGLYFYDGNAPALAADLKPSARGEVEITDLNALYLNQGLLNVERFGRGFAWLDAGTHESLLDASIFIHTVEKRQGLKIACLEEIAYRKGFIDKEHLERLAAALQSNDYGQYLLRLLSPNYR